MHIAFDGGCFQQSILGGIYQVACGVLNAAKASNPDLEVTFFCDPRQGTVREAALAGLIWQPDVIYAPVAASYDVEEWPSTSDPYIRFFVDGKIIPATLVGHVARYSGPVPTRSFAILSRAAAALSDDQRQTAQRGVRIERITIAGDAAPAAQISGHDRRLTAGFLDDGGAARWTDGAGFVPVAFFAGAGQAVVVDTHYTSLDSYALTPGPGAEAVRRSRRSAFVVERDRALATLADDLRQRGCTVCFVNHFTPIVLPGMINVAWAYDLIPLLFPQYFHADAQRNFDENLNVFTGADRIYTISDCTRDDLIASTKVTAGQAITAGIAISDSFSPRPPAVIDQVIAPWGLVNGKYIIVVATIEPRKNHMRVLLAYSDLRRRMPHCPDLLFVGKMGWDFGPLLALRADSGLEQSVKILSDVSEADLVSLYCGALFSAYLSVYEGFGLPIIEAMASGCPVLTSDRSSMAEVATDAAVLVNPYDIDEITNALYRLSNDRHLREHLARRGLVRAKHYNWTRSSDIIMRDLASLHGDG